MINILEEIIMNDDWYCIKQTYLDNDFTEINEIFTMYQMWFWTYNILHI